MLCDAMRWLASAAALSAWYDAVAVRVSCRSFILHNNQLSGSIPSALGSLTALT
jgi:hypothetical protein